MNVLCKLFRHLMYFDEVDDIGGPSTCARCGHKEPAIEWEVTPMPKVKPPKEEYCHGRFDGTAGNGYQPCGCGRCVK